MSENTTTTKSISEIMEMIDYSFDKTKKLTAIAKSIIILGDINEPHTRKTLAEALSKQIYDAAWGVELAGRYIDDLEAAMGDKIPKIDEQDDVTEDDLPFVTAKEAHDDIPNC